MMTFKRSGFLLLVFVCVYGLGCAAKEGSGNGGGEDSGTNGEVDGGARDGGNEVDADPSQELCDGLDNNGNGIVDEGCPCDDGDIQPCYPRPHEPAEGCRWGEQTCTNSEWGECTGASFPAEGEDDCCAILDDNPPHPLYEAFMDAYPPANMPKTNDEVRDFAPEAEGHSMQWSEVNPGNEIVDLTNGGLIEANIETGRAMSREAAEATIPADGVIAHVLEGPVIIEELGSGMENCNGVGWAWGSILYQTSDDAVSELIYLYIGYCNKPDDGDIEAFFYSEAPMIICEAPIVK